MTHDEMCHVTDGLTNQGGSELWTIESIEKVSEHAIFNIGIVYGILVLTAVLDSQQVLHVEQMLHSIGLAIENKMQDHHAHMSTPVTHTESHIHPTFMAQCQALLNSIDTESQHERHEFIKQFLDWNIPVLVATDRELAHNVDSNIFSFRLENFFSSAIMFLNEKGEEQLPFHVFDSDRTVSALSQGINDLKIMLLIVADTSKTHGEHGLDLNQVSRLLFEMIAYALVSQYSASDTLDKNTFFEGGTTWHGLFLHDSHATLNPNDRGLYVK